jgi:hypothetical protein
MVPHEVDRVCYEILVADPEIQVPDILERVMAVQGKVLAFTPHQKSLRDVLVALTEEGPQHV